jgi:DNA-binding response OmpR family regulator
MALILIVDDSIDAQRLICKALESEYDLVCAESVKGALAAVESTTFQLIVLDVGLPDGDGYQVCSLLQADECTRDIPIIFLTGRSDSREKVLAFSLGAEDFMEKPFDAHELRARVGARLRSAEKPSETLRRGNLRIDVGRYRVWVVDGPSQIDLELTPNEFKLLYTLARREDYVLTREQLRAAVWGDVIVGPRTIDSHVSNLRKKMGAAGAAIQAARGIGYRFTQPKTHPS